LGDWNFDFLFSSQEKIFLFQHKKSLLTLKKSGFKKSVLDSKRQTFDFLF